MNRQNTRYTLLLGTALVCGLVACHNPETRKLDSGKPHGSNSQSQNSSPELAATEEDMSQVLYEQLEAEAPVAASAQQLRLSRSKLKAESKRVAGRQLALNYAVAQGYTANDVAPWPEAPNRENYDRYQDNPVKQVSQQAVSTFSVDVDTAAYSNIRRMLNREGRLPPADAVRIEEMVNYFDYNYPELGSAEQPFSVHTEVAPSPWASNKYLLKVGLKGYQPQLAERPAVNLVFLVDVSGSMHSQDKLPLLKKSLGLLLKSMAPTDTVSLAVYAGASGTVLEPTPAQERTKILQAIEGLQAGGSTHGSAGLKLAYELASKGFVKGGINRVIIASDGDMNVGITDQDQLKDLIKAKRQSGIALTTLGFGSGNYNYALMEQLADVGNGHAAYIDSLREAQKVLVEEAQSTLHTIANDVKVQVEFNPAVVSEYRLIGYENRMLAREDFANDKVDAGDIGAGHRVTALYELVLAGSAAEQLPALRYQQKSASTQALSKKLRSGAGSASDNYVHANELAYIKLRYKAKIGAPSQLLERVVPRNEIKANLASASEDFRFAAGVAGFGQLLRGGKYTGNWAYPELNKLLQGARGDDAHGYRAELLSLASLAANLQSSKVSGVVSEEALPAYGIQRHASLPHSSMPEIKVK